MGGGLCSNCWKKIFFSKKSAVLVVERRKYIICYLKITFLISIKFKSV